MKWLLGAEPMPTVNSRLRPSCSWMIPNSCVLVADAAVGHEHDLAQEPPSSRSTSAACSAGAISVPPRRREPVDPSARRVEVLGRGFGRVTRTARSSTQLNWITLKRSSGAELLERECQRLACACSIESALHRAGGVDHVHDLARQPRCSSALRADRRKQGQQHVGLAVLRSRGTGLPRGMRAGHRRARRARNRGRPGTARPPSFTS